MGLHDRNPQQGAASETKQYANTIRELVRVQADHYATHLEEMDKHITAAPGNKAGVVTNLGADATTVVGAFKRMATMAEMSMSPQRKKRLGHSRAHKPLTKLDLP